MNLFNIRSIPLLAQEFTSPNTLCFCYTACLLVYMHITDKEQDLLLHDASQKITALQPMKFIV